MQVYDRSFQTILCDARLPVLGLTFAIAIDYA